jgi:hypothetical protein
MMKLRINKRKSIGRVFYLVEGDKTEPDLIKHVFTKILDYETIVFDKRDESFHKSLYKKKDDKYSQVFVITLPNPQIKCISNSNDFLEPIITKLEHQYYFTFPDSAVYFLFDRDKKSNKPKDIIHCIEQYSNSRDNDETKPGLFLPSYPSIEAFLLNSYNDKTMLKDGYDAKNHVLEKHQLIKSITSAGILDAATYVLDIIESKLTNPSDFSFLDDFREVNKMIFDMEENHFHNDSLFVTLSLFSISLFDLGIIEPR